MVWICTTEPLLLQMEKEMEDEVSLSNSIKLPLCHSLVLLVTLFSKILNPKSKI